MEYHPFTDPPATFTFRGFCLKSSITWRQDTYSTDTDTILDFESTFGPGPDDVIDLTDLLSGLGFDAGAHNINDWVTLSEGDVVGDSAVDTTVHVDADGAGLGTTVHDVVALDGVTGLDVSQMIANGNLDVPES